MAADSLLPRLRTDGKFFHADGERVWLRAVTYGPFPGGWPENFDPDFRRIAEAGFNAIRLFEMPGRELLDAAQSHGLRVFGGLMWSQNMDFLSESWPLTDAKLALASALRETAAHPALAGVYVGNEIPADLVRWMGPLRVRHAIEELIDEGRALAPRMLFAYANYPSTEYLEPENADFTAFNIYLENVESFRSYLKRLHHVAGDRPLVVSEFGLDSRRNGLDAQACLLENALRVSVEEETAGFTVYAWSDRWWNNDAEVLDWDFGLRDRDGLVKPALAALAALRVPVLETGRRFSVIVCTRNGRDRIGRCLDAILRMDHTRFETIVVDDGSTDGTPGFVAARYPSVRLLQLDPCGLSAARNAGAAAANGEILAYTDDDCEPDHEWLARLERIFADGRFAAAGGPNLPPGPRNWHEAVVCAAPGAPSHVMLDDEEAEHLPGCNLTVTKAAFEAIGGFDPRFQTAGDDVDFCWRLRDAGFRLGFAPGAFVWHWRRPSIRAFLWQQIGYGRAENLLLEKHPGRFSKRGGARWNGFVYGGGPVRVDEGSIIYHGPMGEAGYQSIGNRMLPLRGIARRFDHWKSRASLRLVNFLMPRLRAWCRNGVLWLPVEWSRVSEPPPADDEFVLPDVPREVILDEWTGRRWKPGGPHDDWDLVLGETRVLLATEHGAKGEKHTLVRAWGHSSVIFATLRGRKIARR